MSLAALPLAPTVRRSSPKAFSAVPLLANSAELSLLTVAPSQRFWVSPLVIDQSEFHQWARSYSKVTVVFFVTFPPSLFVHSFLILPGRG